MTMTNHDIFKKYTLNKENITKQDLIRIYAKLKTDLISASELLSADTNHSWREKSQEQQEIGQQLDIWAEAIQGIRGEVIKLLSEIDNSDTINKLANYDYELNGF